MSGGAIDPNGTGALIAGGASSARAPLYPWLLAPVAVGDSPIVPGSTYQTALWFDGMPVRVAPRAGSITAALVQLTGMSGGSDLVVTIFVAGAPVAAGTITLAEGSFYATATFAAGVVPVAADDSIGVKVQVSSAWSTPALDCAVELEFTSSD